MRVKLIFPGRRMRALEIRGKNHLIPSETLTALAAVTPAQHQVTIEDENVQKLRLDDAPDVVGITVYTFLAPRAYAIADHYRARGVKVVLGGLHVTGCPEEALAHADAIVVGEGDESWPRLLADLERGRLERVYRGSAAVPLDNLPLPHAALLDESRYLSTASVSATRGCPHQCEYCFNSVAGASSFRRRSIPGIVRQVSALRDSGHPYLVFFDDNLTADRRFARSLCEALAGLGVRWRCAASIEVADDEELLGRLARGGCESLFIGLESVNPGSLAEARKHQNRVREYERQIAAIHAQGIMLNASFVFGFDHDGPDVFQATRDFAIRNRIGSINFHILTPFPGTKLFKRLEREGRILTRDWSLYDTAHAVFQPALLTPADLERGYAWIYREFYSWVNIVRRVPAGPLEGKARFLVFNLALKKANWLWAVLIRLRALRPLFRVYWLLLRVGASRSARIAPHPAMPLATARARASSPVS